jgi:predicted PurR-regulated permease PerM
MALNTRDRIRRSHLFWHLVFFSLIVAVLYLVIKGVGQVLTPVAAALIISYLLDPVVSWLERRLRLARWLGTLILFVVCMIVASAVFLLVVPVLVREIQAFSEAVPSYMHKIRASVTPWVEESFDVQVPKSLQELATQFGASLKAVATSAVAPLGGVAGQVAQRAARFFSTIGTLVLVPIFVFYFLPKFPAILQGAESLIPRRFLGWVRETAREIDRALAAWIRGQLTVIAILVVLYSVGLSIVGIKMAVLIGTLTGLMAFIPYVGVSIGLCMALLVCLLEYTGPGQMIGVAVVYLVVQAADGLFLTPYIVGEKVGLGPVGVLLALMLGGALFGFVGVLLAVPTAAALVVVIKRALATYRDSPFYLKGEGGADADEPQPEAAP